MPDLVPFGRYMLERRLAVGGMAELMLAHMRGPEGFEKRVVIKRILPSRRSDPQYLQMLADEARIAGRLNHPNIVQIHEFGEADGQPFIAMEYLVGDDLLTLIGQAKSLKRPISIRIACHVVAEVAEGLHHAHMATDDTGKNLNIVHRDVSPANIIVTRHGVIKIVDFGIAKHETSTKTECGVIKGKVSYMSPEQSQGAELDRRSDVFALGAVLYEVLTLEPCFRRADVTATLDAVQRAEFEPIGTYRSDVPPAVESLLNTMLAMNREDRCPSMLEVARTLQHSLTHVGTPSARDVQTYFAALTERAVPVTPRVRGTVANDQFAVGDAFAAPDLVLDSNNLKRALADPTAELGFRTTQEPPTLLYKPPDTQEPVDLHLSYGTPPHTRIVSMVALRLERLGLKTVSHRMTAGWAQVRLLASHPSPLVAVAVLLAALVAGLGVVVAIRASGSPQARTRIESVDPARYPTQATLATGRIKLQTVPPGASVTANGKPLKGMTPITLEDIPVGATQTVTLTRSGYRPFTRDITLAPEDGGHMLILVDLVPKPTTSPSPQPNPEGSDTTTSRTPTDATPTLASRTQPGDRCHEIEPGILILDSEPPTEVRLARRALGRTPLRGTKLAPGSYALQLVDVDYSKTVQVSVRSGKTTTSRVVLDKGKLLIDVKPWADVYVKNKKVGTTPLPPIELYEGDYRIRIVNPDKGVDRYLPVSISARKTTRVVERL